MGRKIKAVYFNDETENDLLSFANSLNNFSDWVKDKIKAEINKKPELNPELKAIIEQYLAEEAQKRIVWLKCCSERFRYKHMQTTYENMHVYQKFILLVLQLFQKNQSEQGRWRCLSS